jgi:HSP20 family protein
MLSRYNVIYPLSAFRGIPRGPVSTSMNRLFEDFETVFARSAFAPAAAPAGRRTTAPRVQLRDQGEVIALLAELPGLRLEDIELSIEGATITLKTTPRPTPVPEGFSALRRERQPAAVEWSFELPYAVDAAQASATLDQGRLSVTLPKAPEAKPRSITVKAA